jgi:hypothetical protein
MIRAPKSIEVLGPNKTLVGRATATEPVDFIPEVSFDLKMKEGAFIESRAMKSELLRDGNTADVVRLYQELDPKDRSIRRKQTSDGLGDHLRGQTLAPVLIEEPISEPEAVAADFPNIDVANIDAPSIHCAQDVSLRELPE